MDASRTLPPVPARRRGFAYWRSLVFLAIFTAVVLWICLHYLLPALHAATNATESERRKLAAWATLVLFLVLFILLVGLLMTLRIGRFFFPKPPPPPPPKTPHVDAWTEAGKRMRTPPKDDDAGE